MGAASFTLSVRHPYLLSQIVPRLRPILFSCMQPTIIPHGTRTSTLVAGRLYLDLDSSKPDSSALPIVTMTTEFYIDACIAIPGYAQLTA